MDVRSWAHALAVVAALAPGRVQLASAVLCVLLRPSACGSLFLAKGFTVEFTLGLAQCCHGADASVDAAVNLVDKWCARAKEQQVDLLVFPESLMTRYETDRHAFLAEAQPLNGPFCQAVDALAKKHGLWLVYTVNEVNDMGKAAVSAGESGAADAGCASAAPDANRASAAPANPFNTAVLVDSSGEKRGVYRKVHLFDTSFTRESDRMASGNKLFEPVCTPFGRIGLAICYDLRFPEVARCAALAGCEVLIVPAAWVDGPSKATQWKTLLAARAIENEMFVAGVSRADAGYVGQSCVFGPSGVSLAAGGSEEELVIARIDREALVRARKSMPVFSHRKPELYR